MSVKDNDRERAFAYLRGMTNEKGKKARIAIAGAFGEMLNRVFDEMERVKAALAGWQVSHDWSGPLPEGIITSSTPEGEHLTWQPVPPSRGSWPVESKGAAVEEFLETIKSGSDDPDDPGTQLEKE